MKTQTPKSDDFATLREHLASRYSVQSEFIGAPTLASILGIGRTTIHDQIHEGRFAIPHKLLNRKPLFLFDDVVAWVIGQPLASSGWARPNLANELAKRTSDCEDTLVDEAVRETCLALGIVRAGRRSSKL